MRSRFSILLSDVISMILPSIFAVFTPSTEKKSSCDFHEARKGTQKSLDYVPHSVHHTELRLAGQCLMPVYRSAVGG